MGALSGGRLLTGSPDGGGTPPVLFDVDRYRSRTRRTVAIRRVHAPTVVLGSTQPEEVVDAGRAARLGVEVVRRRSGGGAVYLAPGEPLWADVWVPRHDPLWEEDVARATHWVGEWWVSALASRGGTNLVTRRSAPGARAPSPVVCFAGVGPGEVVVGDRKVVGVAQWRCRQGALFHTCAYARWDAGPLLAVLQPGVTAGGSLGDLSGAAVGTAELLGAPLEVAELLRALPVSPAWEVEGVGGS